VIAKAMIYSLVAMLAVFAVLLVLPPNGTWSPVRFPLEFLILPFGFMFLASAVSDVAPSPDIL
jgi:hypothetical protein